MSQTAILAAIASLKKQMTALENLVAGSTKNLAMLPPLPMSEDEGAAVSKKTKVKKQLSPERIAFLKSPEHIAKLKAGLAAHRAKKAAEKAAGGVLPPAAEPDVHVSPHESDAESSSSSQKRRGPKKLADMTSEELEAHKAKIAANAALSPEEKAAKKAAATAKKEAAAAKKAAKEAKA